MYLTAYILHFLRLTYLSCMQPFKLTGPQNQDVQQRRCGVCNSEYAGLNFAHFTGLDYRRAMACVSTTFVAFTPPLNPQPQTSYTACCRKCYFNQEVTRWTQSCTFVIILCIRRSDLNLVAKSASLKRRRHYSLVIIPTQGRDLRSI